MRPFLFISALVVIASARPEPPVGYSYPAPTPSQQYGSPIGGGSLSGLHGIGGGAIGGGVIGGGHVSFSGDELRQGGGFSSGIGFGSGTTGFSSGLISGSSGFVGGATGLGSSAGVGGATGFGGASGGFISAGPTQVHKHVYVHVAPEEPEDIRPRQQISVAPAQKHYKIIFIKAPSPPTPTAPIIPVQPQNEEKTLVYVLVKKPEDQQDIVIPTPAPTQPSKPEVYFIKYNTRKEAVSGGGAIGGGAIGGGPIGGGAIGGGAIGGGFGAGETGLGGGIVSTGGAGTISGDAGFAGIGATGGGVSFVESSHRTISSSLGGGADGVNLGSVSITGSGSTGSTPSPKYGPPGYQHK